MAVQNRVKNNRQDTCDDNSVRKEHLESCWKAFEEGAKVEAVGIVIEKSFQDGRGLLEELGYPVVSLARLDRFENGQVVFKEADI